MDKKEKIISYIKTHGPSLPTQLAKEIEEDTLMASAHLSELVDKKQLKLSSLKIGSSPLYFLPGQEPSLQKFADNLHDKGKKAFSLLQQKKVLRDSTLDPVIRVALREIKDFAFPLQVTHQNQKEIFWKWYLLADKEAETEIKKQLNIKEEKPETQEKQKQLTQEEINQPPKIEKESKPKPQKKPKKDFLNIIQPYFEKNNIKIISQETIRKNTEFDFTLEIPSAVGILTYYCKAKDKTRINDSDLAAAFAKGHVRKLPVLFLTQGELTKKAKESMNEFKGLNFKKI